MQQIFDTVAAHLLQQNAKSVDFEGQCKYLNHDGLKCAVGCLIKHYEAGLEGYPCCPAILATCELDPSNREMLRFLRRLQLVHDKNLVEDWPELLKEVAKEYNLCPPS